MIDVYQFREYIPCDLRRRTLPTTAGLLLQVAVRAGGLAILEVVTVEVAVVS
jgi:hypothetical protein